MRRAIAFLRNAFTPTPNPPAKTIDQIVKEVIDAEAEKAIRKIVR